MSDDIEQIIKAKFDDAVNRVKNLPNQPPEILLEMYGLYKQALEGDITKKEPGKFNVKARYKFDAWSSKKGMTKEEAMKKYIELIDKLGRS